jgi:DNA mismatch repair ATPase MutS
MGCYVNAEIAVISPFSLLLTKFEVLDNIEVNMSSL